MFLVTQSCFFPFGITCQTPCALLHYLLNYIVWRHRLPHLLPYQECGCHCCIKTWIVFFETFALCSWLHSLSRQQLSQNHPTNFYHRVQTKKFEMVGHFSNSSWIWLKWIRPEIILPQTFAVILFLNSLKNLAITPQPFATILTFSTNKVKDVVKAR